MINKILELASAWNPHTVMLDLEKAVLNILSNTFSQTSLSGYYYHLRQSIHRQVQVQPTCRSKIYKLRSSDSITYHLF